MNTHIDDTRLNDYLEGLVTEDVAGEVDAHLAACEECSARLERLRLLLSELAALPDAATPARDLWSGVQARIGAGSGHREVENRGTAKHQRPGREIFRRNGGIRDRGKSNTRRNKENCCRARSIPTSNIF